MIIMQAGCYCRSQAYRHARQEAMKLLQLMKHCKYAGSAGMYSAAMQRAVHSQSRVTNNKCVSRFAERHLDLGRPDLSCHIKLVDHCSDRC